MMTFVATLVVVGYAFGQLAFGAGQQVVYGVRERGNFGCDLFQILGAQLRVRPSRGDDLDVAVVPARMHEAESAEVKPKRKLEEPFGPIECFRGANAKGFTKASVLLCVLLTSGSKRNMVAPYPVEQDRVQLVVSHYDLVSATSDQRSNLL